MGVALRIVGTICGGGDAGVAMRGWQCKGPVVDTVVDTLSTQWKLQVRIRGWRGRRDRRAQRNMR